MRAFVRSLLLFLLIGLAVQCRQNGTPDPAAPVSAAAQTELLVANPWRIDRVTDTAGKTLGQSQLGLETQALFFLDMQFTNANIVRAIDRTTRQIRNAGDWTLVDGNRAIDVKVNGFRGIFKLVELSKKTLILQQDQVQVNGTKQVANLVFLPSV